RAASAELMGRGISVNNIAPGPMDTPFFYPEETDERVAFHKSQALHNQLTQIEDIAPLVKFLTTDGWWINGQTIFANGGYTTRYCKERITCTYYLKNMFHFKKPFFLYWIQKETP